jgi:putative ABC transport system permease protein
MLVSLTLSIGVFAAAVAGTIGANLADQARYQAGTSLRLVEEDQSTNQFLALPVGWHLRQPGVRAATPALRFASYQADAAAGDFSSPIEVLGVDPATLARVAWFRQDFATQTLSALLAPLTSTTEPRVIVNDAVLNASGIRIGDQLQLSVAGLPPLMATVVGAVRYFPTMNPPEGYYAITNITYLRNLTSSPGPSEMWMTTDGSAATAQRVIRAVQAMNRVVLDYEDSAPGITIVDNPLQVGIYGVTSIGFIIAAGLSMLALVAYLYLSMERRAGDFGVLRALGGSTSQVAAILLLEQLYVVALGVVAALVIGLVGGQLFIPYLPIAQFTTPPFLVDVPWRGVVQLVLILLAAFAVALAVSAYAITRLQISRVLRLGEG